MQQDASVLEPEKAILEIVRTLPVASVRELLDFALFLRHRHGSVLANDTVTPGNAELIAGGTYEIFTPSYDMSGAADALMESLKTSD